MPLRVNNIEPSDLDKSAAGISNAAQGNAAQSNAAQSNAARSNVPMRIVIQGVTLLGKAFRPSDWAERLCGVMSTFGGDGQMRYSPYVRPVMLDGVRCVVVEPSLITIEPRAYRFLLDFAKDNDLVVINPNQVAQSVTDDFCPIPGSALDLLASG